MYYNVVLYQVVQLTSFSAKPAAFAESSSSSSSDSVSMRAPQASRTLRNALGMSTYISSRQALTAKGSTSAVVAPMQADTQCCSK
jgi:hypothetical protein